MSQLRDLGLGAAFVAVATALSALGGPVLASEDVVMLYLVAVLVAAWRFGRAAALLCSALSVAAYNFFFVPPFHTFAVTDTRRLLTFAVLFGAGVLVSTLVERSRWQEEQARARAERLQVLYTLSGELARARDEASVARVAREEAERLLGVPVRLELDAMPAAAPGELVVTLGEGHEPLGALVATDLPDDRRDAAIAVAQQATLALERIRTDARAAAADLRARAEEVRSALLSMVSHDLRTPLATIVGAATTLREAPGLSSADRAELLDLVRSEGSRLEHLVRNLLDMTRLAAGDPELHREWVPLEELVGSALRRVSEERGAHAVGVTLARDLPLVHVDPLLFEQLLVNLLQNAFRHTGPASTVWIDAGLADGGLDLVVHDDGPGLPEDPTPLFEPFVRGDATGGGSGLGLAICRAVTRAHGGEVTAGRGPRGGAAFRVHLPLDEEPPALPAEEAS